MLFLNIHHVLFAGYLKRIAAVVIVVSKKSLMFIHVVSNVVSFVIDHLINSPISQIRFIKQVLYCTVLYCTVCTIKMGRWEYH